MSGAGKRAIAGASLAYLALSVLWAAPASLSPLDTVPDLGDSLHLSYVMAWDAHQLVRRPWAFYDSNSFYPYPQSLTFGDHLLPEALSVAPVFWLTGNAVLASNLAVLLALTASALAMFLLLRELTGSAAAAFLAGLLYAFNSFTRHELPRVQVLSIEWWPLALLFLDRFLRNRRARDAAGFAASLALQGLSGAYYLIYTALLTPLWLAAGYAAARRWPGWHELRTLGAALLLAAAPSALVLWPYLGHLRSLGFEKSLSEGANLLCYVQPPPGDWLWGHLRFFGGCFDVPQFVGVLGGLLMLAGAARLALRRGAAAPPAVIAALTAVAGVALSAGPLLRVGETVLGPGPFALLYRALPVVRGMDGSMRMGVLAVLGGSVLAGLALAPALRRLAPAPRGAVVAALAVLLPLEHWSPAREAGAVPSGARVPSAYRWLASEPGPLVELPLYPDVTRRYFSAYLYFSTYHWRPIPIGRTSFYPPEHDVLVWSLRAFPDETSLLILERLGIRTLVVHPLGWSDPAERASRLAALDADARLRLVRRFDDELPPRFAELRLGRERVYRLESGPVAEAPCAPAGELPREAWALRSLTAPRPWGPPERDRVPTHAVEWREWREWREPWRTDWVRDGDRRTAWMTAGSQREGDGLEVVLPREETVTAATLDLAYPFNEFPRSPLLVAAGGGEGPRRVDYADGPAERWETVRSLLERPASARLVLRFPPRPMRSLRIRVGGAADPAWPPWSAPELRLYGECR